MPRPRIRSPSVQDPSRHPTASADSAESPDYHSTADRDHAAWVSRQYPALKDTVYLDHAAAPPAPAGPLDALTASIQSQLFSNPHSSSTAGVETGLVVERTRTRVLQDLFNVPDDRLAEWDVVFTHGGATQGIKLIGDAWNWRANDGPADPALEYLVESHTSLVGLRGYPLAEGRTVRAHSCPSHLLRSAAASAATPNPCDNTQPTLYTYPAQCNATGARLGLRFCAQIKRANPNAKVLVDAAAYCSTSVLDLGAVPPEEAPDFIVASVYKMFGFPTSLGLLLVRRASAHLLTHSPYFGGGTISSLSLSSPFSHAPRLQFASGSSGPVSQGSPALTNVTATDIHTILEAGTPPFLEIVALSHALDWLDQTTNGEGLGAVSRRTARLRRALVEELAALRHGDGSEVFVEHCAFREEAEVADSAADKAALPRVALEEPGPILGFSLHLPLSRHTEVSPSEPGHSGEGTTSTPDFRSRFIGHVALSRLALVNGIALRSGGLCNTGVWSKIWGFDDEALKELERSGRKCWDEEEFAPFAPFRPLGITRVSLGMASTMDDVRAFVAFVKKFFVDTSIKLPTPSSFPCPVPPISVATSVRRAKLMEVMLYPIKSCSAQTLSAGESWSLTSAGLLYDREFMLVSASTGRALSQKRYPRMALIRPRIDLTKGELIVEAPGMPILVLPLAKRSDRYCKLDEGALPPTPPLSEEESSDAGLGAGPVVAAAQMTNLCGASVESVRVSTEADLWFTKFLNSSHRKEPLRDETGHVVPKRDTLGPGPVELHRLPSENSRHAHFDTASGPPLPLRLSNESPFLLVSEESLDELNGWIGNGKGPVRAQAFRPNLVVGRPTSSTSDAAGVMFEPLPPFWEERVDRFRIGSGDTEEQSFSTLGKCRRCLMVAVDQTTGERVAEPLQTLTQRKKAADTGRVEFGMHCMWREPVGSAAPLQTATVTVGDEVCFTMVPDSEMLS